MGGMKPSASPSRIRRGAVKVQVPQAANGPHSTGPASSKGSPHSSGFSTLFVLVLVTCSIVATFLVTWQGCSKSPSHDEQPSALINSKALLELEKALEAAAEEAPEKKKSVSFQRHVAVAFPQLREVLEQGANEGLNSSTFPRVLRAAKLGVTSCEARINTLQEVSDDLKQQLKERQRQLREVKNPKKGSCPPCPEAGAGGSLDLEIKGDKHKDILGMDAAARGKEILRLRELVGGYAVTVKRLKRKNRDLAGEKAKALQELEAKGGAGAASDSASPSAQDQAYACEATPQEISKYLDYKPRASCPNDWYFVQRLIFKKKCYALPRRRCRALTAIKPVEPLPLPRSLFDQSALDDSSVRWDLHDCKSFSCILQRTEGDCRDCFNLTKESWRWHHAYRGVLPMREVVKLKNGTLRIGLDMGGGTGSFAAHMARFNITVMTTALNVETTHSFAGLPYHETIALRGLIPLHVSHGARLPLYDGVLDFVHSMNSIKYLPMKDFEELIFEWDRVLRVGGILWLDMFYAQVDVMPEYVALLELLEYKKLYWNFTPKKDTAERSGKHVYLNCVLEKQPAPGDEVLDGPAKEDTKW